MSVLHHLNQSALSVEVKLSLFGLFWIVSSVLLTNLLPLGPKYVRGPCSRRREQPAHVDSFRVGVSGQGEAFLSKEHAGTQPAAGSSSSHRHRQIHICLGQPEEGGSSSGGVPKHLQLSSVFVSVGWNR